jgi:sec-independent protein translocase protein TatB
LFDLSITKILVLGIIGLVVFGPDQLPRIAAQAGRALRDLRRLADRARADLADNLGPEFHDFDLNDLNPRAFVRKHFLDDLNDDDGYQWTGPDGPPARAEVTVGADLLPGELPPYDDEAT